MKKKSNLLKGFLATASLYGTLLASSNAGAAIVLTTGLVDVNLNTGAGLAGILNDNDTIQVVGSLPGTKILANKPNAKIGGITTALPLVYGGVEVSADTFIGPLDTLVVGLIPDYGPLKFTANSVTTTITGVGTQKFSLIDFNGKSATLQINDGLTITTAIDNTGATGNGTLNLGNVVSTAAIGSTNSLLAVNINGNGNINLGGVVKANTITVANIAANVTATGLVTGTLLKYTAAGRFTANAGLKSDLDFNNNNGTFNLVNGMSITGNIDSSGGVNGILNAVGGTITGTINNLYLLQCSAGNVLDLQGNAVINNMTFTANAAASGTIRIGGGINS